jgi:hypothetical protein
MQIKDLDGDEADGYDEGKNMPRGLVIDCSSSPP